MSTPCRRIEERLEGAGGTSAAEMPAELARHVGACTRCRGLLEAEGLLARSLGAPEVPKLSAEFTPRLMERLEREGRRRRWARRLLAAYWIAAAAAGALVVSGIDLPPALPTPVWVPLLLTAAGLAGPALALLGRWVRTPGLPRGI